MVSLPPVLSFHFFAMEMSYISFSCVFCEHFFSFDDICVLSLLRSYGSTGFSTSSAALPRSRDAQSRRGRDEHTVAMETSLSSRRRSWCQVRTTVFLIKGRQKRIPVNQQRPCDPMTKCQTGPQCIFFNSSCFYGVCFIVEGCLADNIDIEKSIIYSSI